MGLDMYLYAEKYIGKYKYDGGEQTVSQDYDRLASMFPELDSKKSVSMRVVGTVCYWRKANQIHKWFVDNVQKGEDDCRTYYVDTDKLRALLDSCKKVLANTKEAESLLPTTCGFFFGSTEYGEYYMEDIKNTIAQLEAVLGNPAIIGECELYYHSSW